MSDNRVITPADVERRLNQLSEELDTAFIELEACEADYNMAKTNYELALARTSLDLLRGPEKMTVQQRADQALILCESPFRELAIANIAMRAAKGNVDRIKTQVDLVRSLGTSVRVAMELS